RSVQSAGAQPIRGCRVRLANSLHLPVRRLGAGDRRHRIRHRTWFRLGRSGQTRSMSQPLVLGIAVAYLLTLFAIAWAVEHGSKRLGRLAGSSIVYPLSLAVYCSSWTFNGGVGRAALNGFDFLPIYLGPTLAFCLGPIVIRRILRISKANQITSIADLIGA